MTETELLHRASQMLSRISELSLPDPIHRRIAELRQTSEWGDWSRQPGIYYFIHDGAVVYVGRAVPSSGLGNRVGSQINAFDDPSWAEVIRNDQTIVSVVPFPETDWHWAAALEFWLIDGPTRPRFNKRF